MARGKRAAKKQTSNGNAPADTNNVEETEATDVPTSDLSVNKLAKEVAKVKVADDDRTVFITTLSIVYPFKGYWIFNFFREI
jgi:hypothetical protein